MASLTVLFPFLQRRAEAPPAEAPSAEAALVARARSGDALAFRSLYERFAPPIHRLMRGVLRDDALAADATQETFARAFSRLHTLTHTDRVGPWLFGIARWVAQEQRRATRRSPVAADDEAGNELEEPRPSPERLLLGQEAAALVERALAELTEDRRTVLLLRLDHDLPYQEIAGLMGWSLAKVKVEIHRARQVLRKHLTAYDEATP